MYCNTVDPFRQQMYRCFERSRDALLNLCAALVSESQARSLPELSLSVSPAALAQCLCRLARWTHQRGTLAQGLCAGIDRKRPSSRAGLAGSG